MENQHRLTQEGVNRKADRLQMDGLSVDEIINGLKEVGASTEQIRNALQWLYYSPEEYEHSLKE